MAGGRRAWRLLITRSAEKQIGDLPSRIGDQVERAIQRLIDTLRRGERPQDMRKLVGREVDYRIDSGEYRILFSIVQQGRERRRSPSGELAIEGMFIGDFDSRFTDPLRMPT